MRIGFFGNTNNYPFVLAKALQDKGHSIFFVVTEKDPLHRPESRYPSFDKGYPEWVLDLSHLNEWDFMELHPDLAGALSRLSQCDALILNSIGPSLLQYLNKPAITFLTGWDLSNYANPFSVTAQTDSWGKDYIASPEGKSNTETLHDFVSRQRWGIQHSIAVRYFPKGFLPDDDQILEELGVSEDQRFFLYFSNLDHLEFSPPLNNRPIRIFCGARLTWKLPVEPGRSEIDYKGGDVMVRGLGLFHRETGFQLDIHLVRKGLHVKETEDLIVSEGIGNLVTWHEEMTQLEYFKELGKADIIFDQLGSSLPGLVTLDAMTVGRPVIVNDRGLFSVFPTPSPICQAETPEEVCAHLKRLVNNPEERKSVGMEGRRFVEAYLSPEQAARKIEEKINAALHGLSDKTGSFEIDYAYLMKTRFELRHELVRELAMTFRELELTRQDLALCQEELGYTKEELFRASDTIAHHEKFLKPVRFLINFIKKFPIIDKFIRGVP